MSLLFFFRSFLNTCYNEFSYLVPIVKGVIGRKKGEKMEQNINKLGAFVAALALIASVLVMPNVSAGDEDLSVTLVGDKGLTSYGAKYGHASFTGSVSSISADADHNLTITTSFSEEGWQDDQASIGSWDGSTCTPGGTGSYDFGTLDGTLEFCIEVMIEGDVNNGDSAELVVSVSSSNSTALDTNALVIVSDWTFSTADTDAKTFTESDAVGESCDDAVNCHSYTITLHNNKLDANGDPVAYSDAITISYNSATPGWRIDSDDQAWDEMDMEATIGYIDAGASVDFVIQVSLSGSYALASSYVGNSVLAFQVSDDKIIDFVEFEAVVEDNYAVSAQGSGNEDVDNGCNGQDYTVDWDITIKNFGNLPDSFAITFDDADAVAAAWSITGADDTNTGSVLPKAEEGEFTHTIEMTVPSGLAAGTKHGFTMTVTSDGDSTQTQTQEFSATVVQCYGISMAVDKTTGSADPGASSDYTVTVTNDGNGEDTVAFMTMGAQAWNPTLSEMSSTIASGETGQVLFTLSVPADSSSEANSGMAMVHAYSEGCGEDTTDCDYEAHVSVTLSSNQVFDISAGYYYNASMGSASVQEGMALQMKFNITNNGNGNDNVGVALANAPSWITLSQDTVLVGPGQASTVTIDVMAPASGGLGANTFQIVATSSDGSTTSTTGDFTLTVVEKSTDTSGPTTEEVDDDDGGLPGFGFLSAIAAIGAVLLLRRRL
ncbi:MAG: hypothetical protein BEU03_00640 [Marine Group III euryarchaeote CG-Epi6]|uniref:Alpha-galactosidase NEW3 domain-containing protein n=1 Tax=Marine Group III euryarchaeote CG-Epi6 TaxID=1889000 RepID=A0A1J5TGT7_9ARCH|nr:MAG: hypothetical protein BEU03_00640 [Marine Group III euryarchaeote CG-Epi6]